MKHLFFIALGGSIGAVLRYNISKFLPVVINTIFPIGTLAVNIIGCFFIGFFYDLFEKIIINIDYKSFMTIGLLGALTTFSTYSIETINLFRDGELKLGVLNVFLSNVLGIMFVVLGIFSSRIMLKIIR